MKQSDSFAKAIGAKLKDARKLAGMFQEAVGGTLGLKGPVRHVYAGKLERGEVFSVSLRTVVAQEENLRDLRTSPSPESAKSV